MGGSCTSLGIEFGAGPNERQRVTKGRAGPGDVGRDLDHDWLDQCQPYGAFVFAESVQGGFADLFGPGMPGPGRVEVAAQFTPCLRGQDGGAADDLQFAARWAGRR